MKPLKFRWYDQLLLGWADVIDATIRIVTFGNIIPMISFNVFAWVFEKRMKE